MVGLRMPGCRRVHSRHPRKAGWPGAVTQGAPQQHAGEGGGAVAPGPTAQLADQTSGLWLPGANPRLLVPREGQLVYS